METSRGLSPLAVALVLIGIGLGIVSTLVYASSQVTLGNMNGTVEGVVSVGPSQPVCHVGESCTVNMTGYSLIFTKSCSGLCPALSRSATLDADGRYSISLPSGTYAVTLNSCPWLGCEAAFPRTVSVDVGQVTSLNITVDTGIR
jgi:hypothetical protein